MKYKVGYKEKVWNNFTHTFLKETFHSKQDATKEKVKLQKLGFVQVIIKPTKG